MTTDVAQRRLTAKQESFAQHVAMGYNLTDSYRMAYSAASMKDSTVHRKASGVHSNALVRARIADLVKIEEKKSIADRTELLQIATRIVRSKPDDGIRAAEILKAIEILSRMQGYDSPQANISFNVSVRRSPDEMREILARQISMADLPLFATPVAIEAGDSGQNE